MKGHLKHLNGFHRSEKAKKYHKVEPGSGGYISIFVLLTGMLLILITLSLLTRQMNEVMAIKSFQHRTQAHYLSDSGMDMALWQLYEWSEDALAAYEEGVTLAAETGAAVPSLKDYVRSHVIYQLYRLNEYNSTPMDNPFQQLELNHGIRLKVEASIDESQITITAQGICEKSRVTQQSVVALPKVTQMNSFVTEGALDETGADRGSLGKDVVIQGMHLISRFQTSSIWY